MSSHQHDKSNKHLSLEERHLIENMLFKGCSIKEISEACCRNYSTIQREILRNRTVTKKQAYIYSQKASNNFCHQKDKCTKRTFNDSCYQLCPSFVNARCKKTAQSPHVCNSCPDLRKCTETRFVYRAQDAHSKYINLLSTRRAGIDLTPVELAHLDKLVSPLIKKGHSIESIYYNHADEIPCSISTIYNYLKAGLLSAKPVDTRIVRYKPRTHTKDVSEIYLKRMSKQHRSYEDFLSYHHQTGYPVVELDTVIGTQSSKKSLLTIFFRDLKLMLIYLLDSHTRDSIIGAINQIDTRLGEQLFNTAFKIMLTDNGSEFLDAEKIEFRENGTQRTRLFYCIPNAPYQKGGIEKNHELIRMILPKGKSFDRLTQDDIDKVCNHINSYPRRSLHGRCPYDVAELCLGKAFLDKLGIEKIAPDDVVLKPSLLAD